MPNLLYSQDQGVSARVLEDIRKRRANRGGAYAPAMGGLTESRTESEVNRQAVAENQPAASRDVAMALRAPMSDLQPAQSPGGFNLRAPMTGGPIGMEPQRPSVGAIPSQEPAPAAPAPTQAPPAAFVDPRDQQDRDQAERLRRQRIGLLVAGIAGAALGDANTNQQRMQAVGGALQSIDPRAPLANIEARDVARREAADQERTRAIEDEQRALEADYRRTLMRSMDVNSDRREFQMGRQGASDERLYDPASPLAASRRDFLARLIRTHPLTQAAFGGVDLSQMGARDLQALASDVARRLNAIPNRQRGVDDDMLADIMRGLDEQATAPAESGVEVVEQAPIAPAQPLTRRQRAEAAARRARGMGEPTPAPAGGMSQSQQALLGIAPEVAQEAPAPAVEATRPRRNRTLAQINADILAERDGQPTSTGQLARTFTPRERETVARALERSRTREAGAIAGGIDTRSREAQGNQVASGHMIATPADVARMRVPYSETSRLARDIDEAIRAYDQLAGGRGRHITQAQFEAMRSGGALARLMNAERLSSLTSAFTNAQLRQQSGAAVTDSEAARFFRALNMNALNSPEEFRRAIARARSAALNDLETLRNSNPAAYDQIRGRR